MRVDHRILATIGLITGMAAAVPAEISAAESSRPNILFAIADDWSFGHAGVYGNRWVKTPGFDRVAKQGVLFTNAYTPNAKCAPSRACILTGRNSWQLKQAANHVCFFPAEFKSYAEALAEHGYSVAYTGKGWGPGVAKDEAGKPRRMTGRSFNRRRAKPPARGMSRNDYAANFQDFLDSADKQKPWCFWYGASEPHRGYEFGVGVKRGKKLSDIKHVPGYWPDNTTIRNDMLDYAVEVEHFDSHLVRMLDLLEKRGLLENTLVVVTSDHGMPFPRCKGQAYDDSNHVPLAIMWKKGVAKPGRLVTDYVSFIDFAPTFLEVAGLRWKQAGMSLSPGRSLTDILRSEKSGRVNPKRDHVLLGKERHDVGRPNDNGYPIRGIVADGMLYLRNYEPDRWPAGNPVTGYLNCDGSPTKTAVLQLRRTGKNATFWKLCFGKRPAEELYNVKTDPDCLMNLAAGSRHAAVKGRLQKRMVTRLKEQGDPRMFGKGDVFDKYRYSNSGTRNFYERYLRGEKVRAGWVNPSDFEKKPRR